MLQFERLQEIAYTDRPCLCGAGVRLVGDIGALVTMHGPLSVCFTVHRADNMQVLQNVLGQKNSTQAFESVTKLLVGGWVSLDWVKFHKVSSKLGGRFVLRAVVVEFNSLVASTSAFVVKTCRVIRTQNIEVEHTKANTAVENIAGIGRVYADRLKLLEISTALNLAQCYQDTEGLMVNIREARGKFTTSQLQSLGRSLLSHLQSIDEFTPSTGIPNYMLNIKMATSPTTTQSSTPPTPPTLPRTTPQQLSPLSPIVPKVVAADVNYHHFVDKTQISCAEPSTDCYNWRLSTQSDVFTFFKLEDDQPHQQVTEHMLALPIPNTIAQSVTFVDVGADQPTCDLLFPSPPTTPSHLSIVVDNWQTQQQQFEYWINNSNSMDENLKSIGVQVDASIVSPQSENYPQSEFDIFANLPDLDASTSTWLI
eukprot:c5240_g1_i1.p1 GENE.c5240_g1_i1~~c5240_g1_i1.p1  ORF type:complete len:424 (-),score=105.61 c5240_g1_i1:169-1440(-)